MEILFFIWLIPLLPLLTAWLTRPDQALATRPAPDAGKTMATPFPASAPEQKHNSEFSVAYRRQALDAYREMQEMAEEERRQAHLPGSVNHDINTIRGKRFAKSKVLQKKKFLVKI